MSTKLFILVDCLYIRDDGIETRGENNHEMYIIILTKTFISE